jgi:HlyD family secretion protein
VSGGTLVAAIADMSRVQVIAAVNEIDVGRVRPSMEATIVADAFPESSFTGLVTRIAPEARVVQNVTQFDVLIEVENPEQLLRSGMNCNVTIVLSRKEDVLAVPLEAVQEPAAGKPGEPTVIVVTAQGSEERPVALGERNGGMVEIVQGLSEGEEIRVSLASRAWTESLAETERAQERVRQTQGFTGGANRRAEGSSERTREGGRGSESSRESGR